MNLRGPSRTPSDLKWVAACLLTAVVCVQCAAEPNPIPNGSFERLDARGVPEDWNLLGDVTVTDRARTGDNAMLLRRDGLEGECGLNRAWTPRSGERGAMLEELRGGVTFWYMALEASDPQGLTFNIIPMSDEPLEVGGLRTTFVVPPEHVGDGRWHQGIVAYDYTDAPDVHWVQISPRLLGERAAMIIDDIEWIERTGPIATVDDLRLEEDPERPGHRCTVSTRVRNTGDAPLRDARALIELPPGLAVSDDYEVVIGELAPGEERDLRWQVDGARDEIATITVRVTDDEHAATRSLTIEPQLEITALMLAPSVLEEGAEAEATLLLRNTGSAIVRRISADLRIRPPLRRTDLSRHRRAESLPPGAEARLAWRIAATGQSPAAPVGVTVRAANSETLRVAHEVVVGRAMPSVDYARIGDVQVMVEESFAAIGDDDLRLVFPRADFGLGIGRLQRRASDRWQTLASLPRLSRLVVDGAAGEPLLVYADAARPLERHDAGEALELVADVTDPNGVQWQIVQTVVMRARERRFELELTATPTESAGLLALDGPMVLVGDGAPEGTGRRDAIFPGLEWLEDGETSSDSRVIAPEHPHRIRYVPHPHMVTVPLMCARLDTPEGPDAVVSLSWDHLRPYLRNRNRSSALLASPDRFEGRQATTMGLFAPSMPNLIAPNQRVAHTPLSVEAAESVSLAATLAVLDGDAGDGALVALRQWYDDHGVPEPRPLPHGESLIDEIEFNMAAYMRSMWNEEQQKWHPIFFGPPDWREPRWLPDFLYDLRLGSKLVADAGVAQAARERYEHVVDLSGLAPAAEDLGFHFSEPAQRLLNEGREVARIMEQQHEDGSWRFRAYVATEGVFKGYDYAELGQDGAAEVGTCAANARRVLRFARMTGDLQAREAGLRALDFMERFSVPRGAQTWEVPLHAPDILAAAQACEAYLEGYLLTGETDYLERAVFWAWAGLPFVSTWDIEGLEFLRYASIPVFGATWHTMSWFGQPVQWNGLDYATALRRLAPHDDSADWETIARGLTVSAMYQQYTDEEHQALWPDAISAIDLTDTGANFAPRQILVHIYEMMGLHTRPKTVAVPSSVDAIRINAAAEIDEAKLEDDTLSFKVISPEPIAGYVVIVAVTLPDEVRVNGRAAVEAATYDEAEAPWWRYLDDHGMIEIRLAEPGIHEVELNGIEYGSTAW